MSRVLVTGGVGAIGAAVVRRLLADPSYEARVADERAAPQWMREGCEVHTVDLRSPESARAAVKGCTHVIHLASLGGRALDLAGDDTADVDRRPQMILDTNGALDMAVLRAVLVEDVERFVYGSSTRTYERAELFPTPEDHLHERPASSSAFGFSKLAGEIGARAVWTERGLPVTICRVSAAYGPARVPDLMTQALAGAHPLRVPSSGEQTRTPTYLSDVAEGIVAAMSSPAGLGEDFNISASREVSVAELARITWETCGQDPEALELEQVPVVGLEAQRSWPSAQKAAKLLGWEAVVEL
jgi:UDP-glucose 4-epimerase